MAHMSSDQNPASPRPDTPLINASRTIHRRNIKGERMRQAILNAATSLFAAHGYNYVRIADIAKQVGISDAGVLHHFPSKADLFLAVVRLREADYRTDIFEADTVREMIDRIIDSVRTASRHPDLLRFRAMLTSAAMTADTPAQNHLETNLGIMLDAMEKVIAQGIRAGEIRSDTDARHASLALLAINEGVRNQWALHPDLVDYVATFTSSVNVIYRGIAASPLPSRFKESGLTPSRNGI